MANPEEPRIVRSDEIASDERDLRIAETLRAYEEMSDDDIDLSDIPEVTDFSGWSTTDRFYRPVKDEMTLPLDRNVFNWFRLEYEDYQTAINEALLEHVKEQRLAETRQRRERDETE